MVQELQPLGLQFVGQHIDPGEIAAGAGEAGDETEPGRVFADQKNDRDGLVAALAAIAAVGPPEVTITVACRASSLAISGRRSTRSSAQRQMTVTFSPSMRPTSFRP